MTEPVSIQHVVHPAVAPAGGRRRFLAAAFRWGGLGFLAVLSTTVWRPGAQGAAREGCVQPAGPCGACGRLQSCGLPRARAALNL
jgi:hypothetical protein